MEIEFYKSGINPFGGRKKEIRENLIKKIINGE